MSNYFDQVQAAAHQIKSLSTHQATIGVVSGTGLGELEQLLVPIVEIPYQDIEGFPVSTAPSHKGALIGGTILGVPVWLMAGRLHYYEGYSMKEVTFPIRVLHALGVTSLLITNVSGGTNADYKAGDIVLVRDHINMMPEHPLRGPNEERWGLRFPDMMETYDVSLQAIAKSQSAALQIPIHEGVYFCWQGPSLETPAEYEMIHRLGGDMVGMSTVPEVLVARHMDMKVLVLSVISNQCYPLEAIKKTTLEEVIAIAKATAPKLGRLMAEVVRVIGD